jgi:transposase InsO family protein
MTKTRVVINQWREEYNTIRPHGSLGGMNPALFLQRWTEANRNQQQETLTL